MYTCVCIRCGAAHPCCKQCAAQGRQQWVAHISVARLLPCTHLFTHPLTHSPTLSTMPSIESLHHSVGCSPSHSRTPSITHTHVLLLLQAPSPSVLRGALVGGPDATDAFNNARTNYQQTEPALDYN